MNKTITTQIVVGTVATGAIMGVGVSAQAKPFMNVSTESVREFENEYDKAIQAEYEKMSAEKANKEKVQAEIAKIATEEMKKAHAEEVKAMNAVSNRAEKIYNAPAEVTLLISTSQKTLRGFDKTNVSKEELNEAKVYLNEALDLAREFHKIANANRAVDVQRVVKATELVTDVEKEMKVVEGLEKDHNAYVAQQQALIKAENEAKDKAFTALEKVRIEMNVTSENRLANLNGLDRLVANALDNAEALTKLVNSDKNVSEDLARIAKDFLSQAKKYDTIIDFYDCLKHAKDHREMLTIVDNADVNVLDAQAVEYIRVVKENIAKDLAEFKMTSYQDGQRYITEVVDLVSTLNSNDTILGSVQQSTINNVNKAIAEVSEQKVMNADVVLGMSRTLHKLQEEENAQKVYEGVISQFETLCLKLTNQVYFKHNENKEVGEQLVANLDNEESTKAWTEANQPWFYEKVSTKIHNAVEETKKAVSDVKYTGISMYNTGVLSYNTVVKTLQNADSIREVYRDLDGGTKSSMLKAISPKSAKTLHYVGGTLETLNPVLKYVNGYVKDKDLEFHAVANAQQRTASVLSPVTDAINSKLALAKFKLREAQNAINTSKVYVATKHAVSNVWGSLTGWFK